MVGRSSTVPIMVLVMLVLAMMNSASLLVHAIPCEIAIARMSPCLEFLSGLDRISIPCCRSAQRLSKIANKNPQERLSLCHCLKQAATIFWIDMVRAQQIPQLCHIDLTVGLIDLDRLDCNKFNPPTPQTIRNAPSLSPTPSVTKGEKMKPNGISDAPIISSCLSHSLPQIA